MSTPTLVTEKLAEDGPLSSTTPTPVRTSLDEPIKDEEKLAVEEEPTEEDPPAMSTVRLTLLMLGLSLSMFLVALDFVPPDKSIR